MNLREFKWTREPASYRIEDDRISITTQPYTDLWKRSHRRIHTFYNEYRPHYTLGMKAPSQFEAAYFKS